MKRCPQCNTEYPDDFQYCLNHGEQLLTVLNSPTATTLATKSFKRFPKRLFIAVLVLSFLIIGLIALIAYTQFSDSIEVKITSPAPNAIVASPVDIEGTTSRPEKRYYIIVTDPDGGRHVQSAPVSASGKTLTGKAIIGNDASHSGDKFQVQFLVTNAELKPGRMPQEPADAFLSAPVTVTLKK